MNTSGQHLHVDIAGLFKIHGGSDEVCSMDSMLGCSKSIFLLEMTRLGYPRLLPAPQC